MLLIPYVLTKKEKAWVLANNNTKEKMEGIMIIIDGI